MTENVHDKAEYIHGSSPDEQRRLAEMNRVLNAACLQELALQPGESAVDFGCGTGQFSRLMARTVGGAGLVVGLERDPNQIRQARALATADGESGLVDFRSVDVSVSPLNADDTGTFDVAHARFLLEHVPNPAQVVDHMVRAVRPGGRVVLIDDDHGDFRPWPVPAGFDELWRAYVRVFQDLGNDPYVGRRLVALLGDAGLVDLRNSSVFFGGCAGGEAFVATAENLIAALSGAKDAMLATNTIDSDAFDRGLEGVRHWKNHPSAALWYAACCAHGVRDPHRT